MGAWLYPVAETSASEAATVRGRRPRRIVSRRARRVLGSIWAWLLVAAIATSPVVAAGPTIETSWRVETGSATELVLTVDLQKGWHVNANDPDRPYLIPTTLDIAAPESAAVQSIRYPDAVVHGLGFAPGTKLRLYEGTFAIRVRLANGAPPSTLDGKLTFQACNDETCLPPRTLAVPFDAAKAAKR